MPLVTSSTRRLSRASLISLARMSALLGSALAASPVAAQLNWAPLVPTQAAPPTDPQVEAQIAGLSCAEVTAPRQARVSDQPLFGVPIINWTPDLFAVLQERVWTCTASLDGNRRSFVRSVFANLGEDLLSRADRMRADRSAVDARRQVLLERLAGIDSVTPASEQVRRLKEIDQALAEAHLPPADEMVVSSLILRKRSAAERALQQEADAEQQRLKARQAALQAQAIQERQAFEARMVGFSQPVRDLIGRDPNLARTRPEEGEALLTAVQTAEVALRVCARKFGGYGDELAEATRRRKLIETFTKDVLGFTDARLAAERDATGVETGTGRLAEAVAADRFKLVQLCDGSLAQLSTLLDFGR